MSEEKKKKILIVNKSFAVGGIQSSLINMINALKEDYDIDVCVFNNDGQLKDRVPKEINIIKTNKLLQLHGMSVVDAKKIGFLAYVMRAFLGAFDKIFTNKLFFSLAMLFQKPLKGYDVAIAYHHEASPKAVMSGFYRFVSKKSDAPVKLGWIHYDPYYVFFDDRKNEKYMEQMTKIVCVSQGTANIFKKRHPNLKVPIDYCYNMQDVNRILALSEEETDVQFSEKTLNCFSACRLGKQKAIPRAIRAFAPVLKKHQDIRWYIAGDGDDMPEVKRAISECGVEESVVLLGSLSNPYPYFKKCDLYIQPSIYEAAPMVYGEALICKTPIFTTKNISASEMVASDFGVICENSEDGLRETFAELAENRGKIMEMKNNLEKSDYSNQGIIDKLSEIDDDEIGKSLTLYESFRRGDELTPEQKQKLLPDREFCGAIYKYLRANNGFSSGEEILCYRLGLKEEKLSTLKVSLDMFIELGVINYEKGKRKYAFKISEKVNLYLIFKRSVSGL